MRVKLDSTLLDNLSPEKRVEMVRERVKEFCGKVITAYDNSDKNDWEYWITCIEDKNNTIWGTTLNVANTANGEKFCKKKRSTQASESSALIAKDYEENASDDNSVSHKSENVNTQSALFSKSEGNQLSEGQKEYFAESKIRDENGNLKVLYHGTPNGDFTIIRDGT